MTRVLLILLVFPLFSSAESIFDKVPVSTIEKGKLKQESVIGSFCWHPKKGNHFCADTGLVSPREEIEIKPNSVLTLKMPNQENLKVIQYSFVPVTAEMQTAKEEYPGRYNWQGGLSEVKELKLKRKLKIKTRLEPGLYVLSVSAWWKNYDDANHGFLIKITP